MKKILQTIFNQDLIQFYNRHLKTCLQLTILFNKEMKTGQD